MDHARLSLSALAIRWHTSLTPSQFLVLKIHLVVFLIISKFLAVIVLLFITLVHALAITIASMRILSLTLDFKHSKLQGYDGLEIAIDIIRT